MTLLVTQNTRVSTDSAGNEANESAGQATFSPDGTKIIFTSAANNLVAGGGGFDPHVYMKDLVTGTVTRISESQSGTPGNGIDDDGIGIAFSPDGTKVAFASYADNLGPTDTDSQPDVYIKDLATGAVTLISTDALGNNLTDFSSDPVFSPDGSRIAFTVFSSNGSGGFLSQIYEKDLTTGTLTLISDSNTGTPGNAYSFDGGYSPDGTKYVFGSYADNLVPGDNNERQDVFVKDLVTGDITLISTRIGGQSGNHRSFNPQFSPDGTQVAFISIATNLVDDASGFRPHLYIKDLATGKVTAIDRNISGENSGAADVISYSWSPDGTKVAFATRSSDLVSGDTNGTYDIFVKDLVTGEVSLISQSVTGDDTNGASSNPVWSPDGTKILFGSGASNIVTGDTNAVPDAFIADLTDDGITRATRGNDDFDGTDGNDTIYALTGDDIIDAGEGDDYVLGGGGDDTLYGGHGNDVLNTHDGEDTVFGGTGNDIMHGGNDNDTLHGGGWSDFLYGDDGDDTLYGGTGTNWLIGGAGADKFVLDEDAFDAHADKAKDFDETEGDTLYLEGILVGFDPLTDAITDFVSSTESGGHTTVAIDRDGTGGTYAAEDVLILKNYTGFDVQDQFDNGGIVVA